VSEPKGRETRKDKLNRVQEGGLDVTEGEFRGPQVLAYFGTDVDQGEGAVGVDVDGVMGVGAEGGDKVGGCVSVKVLGPGDVIEESTIDEFLRREPNVTTLFIMDRVLVRVSVGREARWGGEEIFKGADVDSGVKYGGRERSGGRRGRGSERGGGGCNDGRGNVFEGNVLERDVVSDVAGKLEMGPAVLGEWGKKGVKFFLGEADNVGGGVFTELFEIELGGGAKCFEGGCGSEQGWGADNVGVWVNGGRLEGVRVD